MSSCAGHSHHDAIRGNRCLLLAKQNLIPAAQCVSKLRKHTLDTYSSPFPCRPDHAPARLQSCTDQYPTAPCWPSSAFLQLIIEQPRRVPEQDTATMPEEGQLKLTATARFSCLLCTVTKCAGYTSCAHLFEAVSTPQAERVCQVSRKVM